MRNIYRVEAAGYWTVVNAASISAATARGLRIIAQDKNLATAERIGILGICTKIVKRNVSPAEHPDLKDYEAR